MKKETKRYTLVEYCGCRTKHLANKAEYDNMIKDIVLSNRRKTSKYLCGNVSFFRNRDKSIDATIHIYHKLMGPSTISEVDDFTTTMTEEELISRFESELCTKEEFFPDINVCYFETKNKNEKSSDKRDIGIKYIPVIYKVDRTFLDRDTIKDYLKFQAETDNFDFFKGLCNEFCFYNFIGEEIEELYRTIDRAKYQEYDGSTMYFAALRLFNRFIKEYNREGKVVLDNNGKPQISKRRLRDFGMFIRNYGNQRRSPVCYNGFKKFDKEYKKVRGK